MARELHGIIHHAHAAHILAHDWVQDSTLPIPSVRAILLLFAMLGSRDVTIAAGRTQRDAPVDFLECIATMEEEEMLPLLLRELRKLPLEILTETAGWQTSFHQSDELLFSGSRAYEWSAMLDLFNHLSRGGGVTRDCGARVLARRFLEALMLRAVLHRDTEALRGLTDALEGSTPQPPVTNRIASEICGWQPRLSNELGRELTKGAMKAFLSEMYPYFAEAHPNIWADAWKLAGWSTENDRKGPRNNDDAIAIARRINTQ